MLIKSKCANFALVLLVYKDSICALKEVKKKVFLEAEITLFYSESNFWPTFLVIAEICWSGQYSNPDFIFMSNFFE